MLVRITHLPRSHNCLMTKQKFEYKLSGSRVYAFNHKWRQEPPRCWSFPSQPHPTEDLLRCIPGILALTFPWVLVSGALRTQISHYRWSMALGVLLFSLFGCVGTERSQLKDTWCSLKGRRRIWGLGELMVTFQPLLSAINSEKFFTNSLLLKFCHEHLITINRKYTCAVIIVTGCQRTFLLKVYMWKVVVCVCLERQGWVTMILETNWVDWGEES